MRRDLRSRPLTLPGRNAINMGMLVVVIACIAWLVTTQGVEAGAVPLGVITVASLVFGAHLVLVIGGGDMPVVV